MSGSARIPGDRRTGEIALELLSDAAPELDETFTLRITRVEGGAEVDTRHNTTSFTVRYRNCESLS